MAQVCCLVCQDQATVFCENDGAFLCRSCDRKVHSSNAIVSRHLRARVCELCHKKVSAVFCKNDRAFLCEDCDLEIHQSNPLAARHEVVPIKSIPLDKEGEEFAVVPCASAAHSETNDDTGEQLSKPASSGTEGVVPVLSTSNSPSVEVVLPSKEALLKSSWGKEFDVLDLDNAWLDRLEMGFDFSDILADNASEGLVPNFTGAAAEVTDDGFVPVVPTMNEASSANAGAGANQATLGMLSLPSLATATPAPVQQFTDVPAAVPTATMPLSSVAAMNFALPNSTLLVGEPAPLTREQRVARYREKRKNRKFEKTIRYASRKAYAEVRPRIKGRFAKKEELLAWQAGEEAVVPDIDY